jgi:hypothetical protein
MADPNPLQSLADLLRGTGAQPIVSPERPAPSTIYDLQYRLMVNACAFEIHAKKDLTLTRRLQAAKLKLLQFIAIRPWLLPVVRQWSASQSQPQLSVIFSQYLRRGFLGDKMHDDVIAFLEARDILIRVGAHLTTGHSSGALTNWYLAAVEHDLFADERLVLQEVKNIMITNRMLEGW